MCDKVTCLSRTHFLELPADLEKAQAYYPPEAPSPTPANTLACMSAHAQLAESVPSPVAVYPQISAEPPAVRAGAQWHGGAHSQFVQAVLWWLQPVAVEKVVIHLMVLDSRVGRHAPSCYFPHGHAESPLRTKQ